MRHNIRKIVASLLIGLTLLNPVSAAPTLQYITDITTYNSLEDVGIRSPQQIPLIKQQRRVSVLLILIPLNPILTSY